MLHHLRGCNKMLQKMLPFVALLKKTAIKGSKNCNKMLHCLNRCNEKVAKLQPKSSITVQRPILLHPVIEQLLATLPKLTKMLFNIYS